MITITEALSQHHNEIRQIMKSVEADSSKFVFLKKHMVIHHELKKDLLLKELNGMTDTVDELPESMEEHFVLNIILLDLDDFQKDNFHWKMKYKVLKEILNRHLSKEEEGLFPEVEKKLPKKKQWELGNAFINLKNIRIALALEAVSLGA